MQPPFSSGFVVQLSPQIITETNCTDEMDAFSSVIAELQVILSCLWLGVAALITYVCNKQVYWPVNKDFTVYFMINMQRKWFTIIAFNYLTQWTK